MSDKVTAKELIEKLQKLDPDEVVQYLVVKESGEVVTMNLTTQGSAVHKMTKLFK